MVTFTDVEVNAVTQICHMSVSYPVAVFPQPPSTEVCIYTEAA